MSTATIRDRANVRLAQRLAELGLCLWRAKGPRGAQILHAAQSAAARVHAQGERFHAENRTIYPARHYHSLEKMLGPMSAPELALFDAAYEAYMAWHAELAELDR